MNIDERFSRDSTWAFFGVWASSVQTQYPKDPKEQRWESRFFMCMMLERYKVSFQKLDRLRPHHFTTSAQLPWRRSFFSLQQPSCTAACGGDDGPGDDAPRVFGPTRSQTAANINVQAVGVLQLLVPRSTTTLISRFISSQRRWFGFSRFLNVSGFWWYVNPSLKKGPT